METGLRGKVDGNIGGDEYGLLIRLYFSVWGLVLSLSSLLMSVYSE